MSGEQIAYTYDSLNRLASATSSVDPGWGQSYTYDGFGNLTNQTVTKGTAPSLSVSYDPATNRRTGESADANGNICSGWWNYGHSCPNAYTYDVENRIMYVGGSQSTPVVAAYSYAPGNKRVWRGVWSGFTRTVDEVTFWGANGQKLTTYNLSIYASTQLVASATGSNYYFGGKLIKKTGGYVTPDRLGSIGKYFPYGQERPSATTDGKEKFATYFRDSETGLDYAQNRYHQPGMGRFMTADAYAVSNPKDPSSWNRYSYVEGDPINYFDPAGQFQEVPPIQSPGELPGTHQIPGGNGDPQCMILYLAAQAGNPDAGQMFETYCAGGGYLGGFAPFYAPPPPVPKIISANPTAAQVTALNQGFQNALSKVGSLNCAQLFEPTAGAETAVGLASDTLTSANYYIMQNLGVTALTSTDNTVFLNAQGLFFNVPAAASGSVSVTIPGPRGRQQSITFASAQAFQAFTLLHELGHETGVFGSDRNNPALNGAFSRDVLNDCFTTNSKGQYQ